MMSLFDYLGRAAGPELGKQVAEYAKIRNAKHSIRHVSTATYVGEVMLYEKDFLDEYFGARKVFGLDQDLTEINTQLMEDSFNNYDNTDKVF